MLIKHLQKFTLATVGVLIRTKKWGGCMYQEGMCSTGVSHGHFGESTVNTSIVESET